ncbi:MAG: transporter substrate-binding domain-containing protein, partial [Sneathiellales bacterium]|nr:transporter substrate-binding domain-containing protein [Sneathiellales bacterium]
SIYCGASRDPEREKIYQYSSQPLYMVSNILVTHRENTENPETVQELINAKVRIGTYFGTGSAKFLKSTGVLRVNERYTSLEKGMQSVASREIDYFFYHDLGLLYFLSRSSFELRAVPTAFRSYAHWMIMSPDMPEEISQKLDDAVSKLVKEGVVAQIRKGYEPK